MERILSRTVLLRTLIILLSFVDYSGADQKLSILCPKFGQNKVFRHLELTAGIKIRCKKGYLFNSGKKEEFVICKNGVVTSPVPSCKRDYSICGTTYYIPRDPRLRIVGGRKSARRDWPWVVKLLTTNSYGVTETCGGTLLNEEYILTAAHCLNDVDLPQRVKVFFGNGSSHVTVRSFFIHQQYDPKKLINDIAIIKIQKINKFNRFQQMICLPRELKPQNLYRVSNRLFVLGWGGTKHVPRGFAAKRKDLSKNLKQVEIPFIETQKCAENVQKKLKSGLKNWYFNSTTQFCAADTTGQSDTCSGDSGGPVMVTRQDENGHLSWYQIGIVSWGNGCAQKGEYAYYTKVSPFLKWIDSIINVVNCGDPGNPINGITNAEYGYTYQKDVKFSCNGGYVLEGNTLATCQQNGQWSSELPKCLEKCLDPSRATNARLFGDKFFHGKSVIFLCPENYVLEPLQSSKLTCKNGKWNKNIPQCKVVNCGDPGNPVNGISFAKYGYTYQKDVKFSCNDGYVLEGNTLAICQQNGQWSSELPKCLEKCSDPLQATNAHLFGDKFFHGKSVMLFCLQNYVLEPLQSSKLTCENGKWNKKIPQCKAPCQQLPWRINYGYVRRQSTKHGSRTSFSCRSGYKLTGSSSISCNDGKWSHPVPKCLVVNCGDPGNPINGITNAKYGYTYNQDVNFSCNDGYVLEGNTLATCQQNGQWSSELPKCLAPCQQLPWRINYGYVRRQGTKHGSRVSFSCRSGYKLTGSSSIRCNDGKWSHPVPKCLAICRTITRLPNGVVNGRRNLQGDELEFKCNKNYVLEGKKKVTCRSNQRWSATLPRCKAPCQQQVGPKNGKIIKYGFIHNKQVQFECNWSYVMEGSGTLTCLDGRWSSQPPRCLAPCPQFNQKVKRYHHDVIIEINGFRHGETAAFACDRHLVLKGNAILHCSNGRWSSPTPTCEPQAGLLPCLPFQPRRNEGIFRNYNGYKLSSPCRPLD